jgi:hypothetical protein
MKRRAFLVGVGALALVSARAGRASAGACARRGPGLVLLTPDRVAVTDALLVAITAGAGGGAVRALGSVADVQDAGGYTVPAPMPPDRYEPLLVFRDGASVARRIEPIAPGLARVVLDGGGAPGRYEVRASTAAIDPEGGGPPPVIVEMTTAHPPRALAAPRLTRARVVGGGTLEVSLAAAPPASAIALIAETVDAAGAGTPTVWTALATPGRTIDLAARVDGRCAPHTPWLAVPEDGASVRVALVDALGRVSPASRAITLGPPRGGGGPLGL